LEEELFNFIENDIEKTPVAYEEALFESKSVSAIKHSYGQTSKYSTDSLSRTCFSICRE
jgi:hypothetical protein